MGKYSSLDHLHAMQPLTLRDLYSVEGKVAVVTGGSRGIGLMIAKGLVQNGAKVYVVSRKQQVCDEVAAALNNLGPGSAVALAADLSTDDACKVRVCVCVYVCDTSYGPDPLISATGAGPGCRAGKARECYPW